MLIKLARKQVDDLLTKVGEAKTTLESCPSTTVEMAEQLIFLDDFEDGVRSNFPLCCIKSQL